MGTQMMPMAKPCRKPLAASTGVLTSRLMLLSQRPDSAWMAKPVTTPTRGSNRATQFDRKKPATAPMPRQLMMKPTSVSG